MFQLLARICRCTGSCGLAAILVSVLVGTAAAQDYPDTDRMPAPDRNTDLEQFRQMLEDRLRNAKNRSNYPNARKSTREVENGANGVLAAVIIAVGVVGLLVGLYILRRMTVRVHTRRSALDDPRVRAYMLALEGQKPEDGSPKTEVGSAKAGGRSQQAAVFAERGQ
jgi:hypothetical protein